MATSWTPERRARQAEQIRTWRPWEQATGPRSPEGKATASRNAWSGGHRATLRELSRLVNAEIREARDVLKAISRIPVLAYVMRADFAEHDKLTEAEQTQKSDERCW